MIIFTDIDNTVIRSHRHMIEDPVVWVEYLNGRRQSFVSARAYGFYKARNKLKTIPVTTRTPQQYDRLQRAFAAFGWRDALLCNGAILLRDGATDQAWLEESMELSQGDRHAFDLALGMTRNAVEHDAIVAVEPFMFYVKATHAEEAFGVLSQHADSAHLLVLRDSRKTYCIPRSLNKGRAVRRYASRFGYDEYIAAGDSVFDIPMLEQANICICPTDIPDFDARGIKNVCNGYFPDEVCRKLEELQAIQ